MFSAQVTAGEGGGGVLGVIELDCSKQRERCCSVSARNGENEGILSLPRNPAITIATVRPGPLQENFT